MNHFGTASISSAFRGALFLMLVFFSSSAFSQVKLDDSELDRITAGNNGLVPLQAQYLTQRGNSIEVDGDIEWSVTRNTQEGQLQLRDGAQQNLQSMINVNAVNSTVNVFLNLNFNINSTTGDIQQFNLNGTIPAR